MPEKIGWLIERKHKNVVSWRDSKMGVLYERAINLPASQITSCVFAGPDLNRMFVTSAAEGVPDEQYGGALFEVDPQTSGYAPGMFGG